jgi:hypothetical protein
VGVTAFEGADFGRLLEDTRRTLGALRSGGLAGQGGGADESPQAASGAGAAPPEPPSGVGSAADGKITAKVAAGGHLEELVADPRLLRSGAEELCAQIMVAVNAAVDDLRARTAQASPATMDPAELAGLIEDLQTESLRQMSQFSQGVAETVARIRAAAGGEGRDRG